MQSSDEASGITTHAKLLLGPVPLDCQTGPVYPNGTNVVDEGEPEHDDVAGACPWKECGTVGCLYNLTADPTESDNLLAPGAPPPTPALAKLIKHMRARIVYHNATAFSPDRGEMDTKGACAQAEANGGVWGPWLP